jgi:signal peptidase I
MDTHIAVHSRGLINKKYLNLITTGIAVIIGIIILILLFFKFVPGYSFYIVKSGSMVPAIGVGNLVFTGPHGAVEVGQIVTFQIDGETVTHRIFSIDGNQIMTKGDANKTPDTRPITLTDIKGTYLFQFPGLGYLTDFISTKKGWFILVIIPSIILVLLLVKEILKEAFKKDCPPAKADAVLSTGRPFSQIEVSLASLAGPETNHPKVEKTPTAVRETCIAAVKLESPVDLSAVFSNVDTTDQVKCELKNILADY